MIPHNSPASASPIADLSYRNYDGPLDPPVTRWWAIAKMAMRLATQKRGFWIWSALSGYWYVVLLVVFFIADMISAQTSAAMTDGKSTFFSGIIWKDQFVHAFSFAQILFFVLALLLGTGSIANDNRAKALLVYLSKPCSRLDYVIGKWLGVFIPLTAVAFVPMLLFWLYGALSFREYGFISSEPFLLPKLFLVATVTGALHASLSLGISSMFDQARVAGATYAGLYFLSNFFTKGMQVAHGIAVANGETAPKFVDNLFYASIDGVQIAMAKLILGTSGSPLFAALGGGSGRGRGPFGEGRGNVRADAFVIPSPPLAMYLPLFLLLVAAGFAIAWSRVRAVEVVR